MIVLVALMTSLALFTGMIGEAAAAVRPKLSEWGKDRRPGTQKTPRIEGKTHKAGTPKLPGQAGTPIDKQIPEPTWPASGQVTADLSAIKPDASTAAPWVQAGKLPVWLTAPTPKRGVQSSTRPAPSKVRVQFGDQKLAEAARTDGVLVTLSGQEAGRAKVGLNYSQFATAHGGDWASRLRLVRLPSCALTTPAKPECQKRTPLPTLNDPKTKSLSADVDIPAGSVTPEAQTGAVVLAAEAGASGPGGDWSATQLTPASSWNAGTNTGEFSWSYPVRLPPVPGGLLPEITIGYSSGAVDGKTAADNSQASWIGDGFSYWPGFIERKYKPCIDDGHTSGDLCWGRDNAVLSLGGKATELLYDSGSKSWRPKNDDGSRVERLTGAANGDDNGEWWRVTTMDGTQYVFGKDRPDDWSTGKTETNSAWTVPVFGDDSGEPCYDATFKDAHCPQAWRWNLDHVIDPHKNTITYYYGTETNNYTRVEQFSGGTKYTSGGYLKRIDYGQRQGETYATPATARVRFDVADRTDFPDDQICKDGDTCGFKKISPTFFDRKRLTSITTELLTNKTAGTYSPVDVYDLGQTYQNGVLWLHTIDQTGKYGTDTKAPQITLTGQLMPNRVVTGRGGSGVDALPGFDRPRLVGVNNGTGSTTSVGYSDPYVTPTPAGECVYSAGNMPEPKSNTKRCFPVKWTDPNGKTIDDWYHKYVASYVIESDDTGGSRSRITDYTYVGGAAWRYAEDDGLTKDKWRHWSQWRGYSKVRTVVGDGKNGEVQSRTETTYARGMDGNYQGKGVTPSNVTINDSKNLLNTIDDIDTLAGVAIETRTFNGSFDTDAEVTASVSMPKWQRTATRTFKDTNGDDDITVYAGWVKPAWTKARSRKADGTDRYTETYNTYDPRGRTVAVDDEGDPGTAADDTCTRTVYPSGLLGSNQIPIETLPIRTLKVAVDCDNGASDEPNLVPGDMISDVKTIYDGGNYGDFPTKGDDSRVETLTNVSAGRSVLAPTVTNIHDRYGRVTSTTQVGDPATTSDDRTTTSGYTDAAEGWLKSSTVTTPPVNVKGTATRFTTTTEYNPARGTPTKVTDTNGRVAEAVYDGMGRIVQAWLPGNSKSSNPDRPSTIYTYAFPANGNPVSITTKTLRKTDPNTYDTSVEVLDGLLRPRQSQTEAPGGGRMVTDTKYDSRGLVFKANAPYAMSGNPSSVLTSADDNQVPSQTISTYDGIGRPLTATLFSNSTRKWTTTNQYKGEQSIVIPPNGAMPTMSITDARGRTVETRQYKTADLSGAYLASTYSYDGAGRQHEVRDAAGNVWKTTYDVQGRPATTIDPDKGATTLTYDHFDQVATSKDARGTTLTKSYDKLGRTLEVKNGSTPLTSYIYDTLPYALGLPVSSTRHIGADKYVTAITGYDGLYRAEGTSITIPASQGTLGKTYTTTQSYNFNGSPLSTTYPAAGNLPEERVTTEYDADGLPEWSHGLATYVADTIYNSHGDVTQLSLAAVSDKFIWQTFDRDEATQRLTRATTKRQTSTATYDVEAKYDYTDSGSIKSILTNTVSQAPDRQCFNYDYAQRLTQAWSSTTNCDTAPSATTVGGPAPYWTTYEYDANGEKIGARTKEIQHAFSGGPASDKTRTYTYPASLGGSGLNSPHALKSVTETQGPNTRTDLYSYDETGNTTTRPGQKLIWDAEGNLSKVTDTSDKELASFIYDAGGSRLIRKDSTGTTLYLPSQEIRLSFTGAVSAIRYYSHGGQTVAYRTGTSNSTVQFLLPDYQGSADATVNAVAQDTWSLRRFGPFGGERQSPIGTWPTQMDKGYVGGTKDASTGLTHLGARDYDPGTGRFISVDPMFNAELPGSWNGYGYAENNPIDRSDPSGMCSPEAGCPHHPEAVCGTSCDSDHGGQARNSSGAPVYRTPVFSPQPQPPAKPPCTSWVCKAKKATGGFVKKHSATIASVAVGVGCGAAVGWTGVGAVGCAAAAGAVYGAMSHAQNTPRDQWSASGFLKATATGAAVGAVTAGAMGLAGRAAAPLISRVAPKISSKIKFGSGGKGGSPAKGNPAAKAAPASAKKTNSSSSGRSAASTCAKKSFVPGTAVLMADGTQKAIDKLKVGDKVLATNPETGKTAPQTVLSTFASAGVKNLVALTIDLDGGRGHKTGTLTATDNHPFWLPDQKQWTEAGKLKPGMWLRTSAGTHVQITGRKTRTGYQRVHNLSVDVDHTYYVAAAATPVLVHNCGNHPDDRPGLDFTDAGRQQVYDDNAARNGGQFLCEYCGQEVTRRASIIGGVRQRGLPDDAQIDHVRPRWAGGCGSPHNGCVACRTCNRDKWTKTLEQWDDELRDFLPKPLADARHLGLITI
ncbi:polymorphic toxin-type HINT domain-containing protein [Actinomadura fulvescens]